MIISRTPMRISLGGGGTDIPAFYKKHGGFLIAGAINKYVYVCVHENFSSNILLKYAQTEEVDQLNKVRHPIIKACLAHFKIKEKIEITSMADIPAGTGLGSSGSFTVGLLNSLSKFKKNLNSNKELAELACKIEIEKLRQPIGKQDQYIASLGGLTSFEFKSNEEVEFHAVRMNNQNYNHLEENLVMFFTGIKRSTNDELTALNSNLNFSKLEIENNLKEVKKIGFTTLNLLENGNLSGFGEILTKQWKMKYVRSRTATHKWIDGIIHGAISHGAIGGKLVGAGGGGFLLMYAEKKIKLRRYMKSLGLTETQFKFENNGSSLIV